jgi:hypothetical protein
MPTSPARRSSASCARLTVRTGQQHGIRVAAARQLGLLQGAEGYFGTDALTGQEVDPWSKFSEASGRLGSAAAAGAGVGRFLTPKLEVLETPAQIVSRVAQQQADSGLPHLGKYIPETLQQEFVRTPKMSQYILGQGVHEATEKALERLYPGRFEYRKIGPDFFDNVAGREIELTTPGQVNAHVAKGGAYSTADYATYVLPKKR